MKERIVVVLGMSPEVNSHSSAFEVPAGNMFQFFADLESSRPICDLHQFFGSVSF
jgi:hypothetical protein